MMQFIRITTLLLLFISCKTTIKTLPQERGLLTQNAMVVSAREEA